uniref:Allantoate amidinohydrolase n=1 Tax=Callorhinchus milii TaxID=7868 RepID=A0A4W3HGJ9_CALMI
MAARPVTENAKELPDFMQLNDLACQTAGGKVLFATDDWFASAENLLKREAAQWKANAFTEFGKWMDGWETRRKRIPGHDWCVIQLGVPGVIHGFDVDTSYFTGNYAPRISIQAACLDPGEGDKTGTAALEEEFKAINKLKSNLWTELVPMTVLQPGYIDTHHNYLPVQLLERWTHIRLNMYPDGGIARFRVYGVGHRDWSAVSQDQTVDLAAMVNGGVCVGYSNAHFGHPKNMLGIGRSNVMSDGWETARRLDRPAVLKVDDHGVLQVPGCEWAVFRLGHPGVITRVEIDTCQFKGNFPDNCKIEACAMIPEEEMESVRLNWENDQDLKWKLLLPVTKLHPHLQHFFEGSAIKMSETITHVRLIMAPDGGISRMRLTGHPSTLPTVNHPANLSFLSIMKHKFLVF